MSYKIYMISLYVLQLSLMSLGLYAHMEGCHLIFVLKTIKTIKTDHSVWQAPLIALQDLSFLCACFHLGHLAQNPPPVCNVVCVACVCGGVELKSRFSCQTSLTSVSCITALINNMVHWGFLVGNCPDSPLRLVSISTWPAPRSIRNGLRCRCLEVTWTPQREAGFIYRLSFIMCALKTTESFKKWSSCVVFFTCQ